jgi:hypothetical protein
MREHPAYVAETAFWNLVRTFHLSDIPEAQGYAAGEGVDRWLSGAGIYGFYPLALLALAGALLPAARRAPWFVLALVAAWNRIVAFARPKRAAAAASDAVGAPEPGPATAAR